MASDRTAASTESRKGESRFDETIMPRSSEKLGGDVQAHNQRAGARKDAVMTEGCSKARTRVGGVVNRGETRN